MIYVRRLTSGFVCCSILLLFTSFTIGGRENLQKTNKPNIVILLADDLGYGDLSCYGSEQIKTPNLDNLAAKGIRFTDFYAASAVCSPSRAALLTGRFSVRAGVYSWIHTSHKMHLHRDEKTIAEVLKENGYQTAHIGKWHLAYDLEAGSGPAPTPKDQGFDYWMATGNNAHPSHHKPDNFVKNGKALGELPGYSCQIVVDEAINWLENSKGKNSPFYLNLWFHEPHQQVAAPEELTERHKNTNLPAYYGSVENMDMAIGRLMKKLNLLGLSENTLVIFMSDNGSYRGNFGSNGILKAGKTTLWEGGIRVPGIIYWPSKIKTGRIESAPAGVVDILPTICNINKIKLPTDRKIDGTSLLPIIENKPFKRNKPLYWFYSPSRPVCAIREGDWTLIADPVMEIPRDNLFMEEWIGMVKESELTNFRLFNLKEDPGQKDEVSTKFPEKTEEMKKKMLELHKEVVSEARDWRSFSW